MNLPNCFLMSIDNGAISFGLMLDRPTRAPAREHAIAAIVSASPPSFTAPRSVELKLPCDAYHIAFTNVFVTLPDGF